MVTPKPEYADPVREQLTAYFYEKYYRPLLEALGTPEILNSKDDLINALRRGTVKYADGTFYGAFNSLVSRTLKGFAEYDGRSKTWKVTGLIPGDVLAAASTAAARFQGLRDEINQRIREMEQEIPEAINIPYAIDPTINGVTEQAQADLVNLGVKPEFTRETVETLRKEYTQNMDLNIRNWHENQIQNLRKMMEEGVLNGYTRAELREAIKNQWGVTENKARFLARNEAMLLVSSIRDIRFQDAGVTKYRWKAVKDDRHGERRHDLLDGKVFSYDDPPVIDVRTGQRGNPGQTYQCRCVAIPLV